MGGCWDVIDDDDVGLFSTCCWDWCLSIDVFKCDNDDDDGKWECWIDGAIIADVDDNDADGDKDENDDVNVDDEDDDEEEVDKERGDVSSSWLESTKFVAQG